MSTGAPEYEVVGILQNILPLIRYGHGKQKQTFLLLSDTPSPQLLPIEARNEQIATLQRIPLLSKVKVRFALEGQLWHPPQGSPRPILRLVALEITRLPE